jgi:hypothetical protein
VRNDIGHKHSFLNLNIEFSLSVRVIKLSQYGKFVQRRDPRSTLPELMRAVLIGERGVRDEGIKEK